MHMTLHTFAALLVAATLTGCASVGVGFGIPVGPFTLGVGMGSDGALNAGVGTGYGPLGVGVGVNQHGQVTGNAGLGTSVPLGSSPARVGVGVGTGAVLYDPGRSQGIPILRTNRIAAPDPYRPSLP